MVLSIGVAMTAAPALATNDDDDDYDGSMSNEFCSATADAQFVACKSENRNAFFTERAVCINVTGEEKREKCFDESEDARKEGWHFCEEQFDARLGLCGALGEDRYDPRFRPNNFVDPTQIGTTVKANKYWPLVQGTQWIYEEAASGQRITVTVTEKTKLISGVTCVVVNDVVEEDGNVIEDTDDWIAQDKKGNVWYCGEEVKDYESFEGDDPENPELVAIDGSFKVGRDGARPGILMYAKPEVGQTYRQEFSPGNAEDAAEVIAIDGKERVPGFACNKRCLVTRDFSPLDPGVEENKFYKPGVGLILEIGVGTTERVELVSKTVLP
jgi:hypothetical protein